MWTSRLNFVTTIISKQISKIIFLRFKASSIQSLARPCRAYDVYLYKLALRKIITNWKKITQKMKKCVSFADYISGKFRVERRDVQRKIAQLALVEV